MVLVSFFCRAHTHNTSTPPPLPSSTSLREKLNQHHWKVTKRTTDQHRVRDHWKSPEVTTREVAINYKDKGRREAVKLAAAGRVGWYGGREGGKEREEGGGREKPEDGGGVEVGVTAQGAKCEFDGCNCCRCVVGMARCCQQILGRVCFALLY